MKKEIYIFGNGAMGTALACGLRNSSFEVIIVGRSKEKMEKLKADGFKTEFYTSGFDIEGKNIMFAFKSHALSKVTNFLSGRANSCISVLAMASLEDIKKSVKSKIFAVAMPNIAAQFNKSLTPFVCEIGTDVENPDVLNDLICEIIAGFGKPVEFESESVFNIAGIVSGCVPAYLSLVAEGLCEGCVREGLKAEVAYELIQGAFKSTTSLLNNFHPAILKDKICSPAGTTIKGVCSLEDDAIRASMIRAIKASRKKKS